MTVLEQFISFAKGLPAERRQSLDDALATLMEAYSEKFEFTGEELAEIDRRLAETDPQFARPDDITGLLGKPFSA